ncbi:MAG: tRNA (cytidine(34)-2'-O)-methyltransferase [Devosiaceae bacterium]|nr:tRNA (cytidine(34)-2'-O)-methyltransferase [Devosiaceae bacterium MH13]
MVALALFQPEIPSNTGALMRLSACLSIPLHIIGPTGFVMTDRALRRAGMDYRDSAKTQQHPDFEAFEAAVAWERSRFILMTTQAPTVFTDHVFAPSDIIVMGRETAGAPDWLHQRADARLSIPMQAGQRSLNLALAASMAVGEALRQTGGFPDPLASGHE